MNSRLSRTAAAIITAAFAFALTGCMDVNGKDVNKAAGDVVDAVKGDKTSYLTSAQVAAIRTQENDDAGLKATLAAGYEPIAFTTRQDGTVFTVLKVCDGKSAQDCLNADPAHPVVRLHLKAQPAKDTVTFNGKYELVYPVIGGRHGGVSCMADISASTGTGLDGTVVGNMVDIGKAVDKQFADAANGAEQVVKIGQADYNCTANWV